MEMMIAPTNFMLFARSDCLIHDLGKGPLFKVDFMEFKQLGVHQIVFNEDGPILSDNMVVSADGDRDDREALNKLDWPRAFSVIPPAITLMLPLPRLALFWRACSRTRGPSFSSDQALFYFYFHDGKLCIWK